MNEKQYLKKLQELQDQIHAGRRQKLRDRYLLTGLEHFNETEMLEFALTFCIPRCDTNPMAHDLLHRFGELSTVLGIPPDNLWEVSGIGEQAAIFLHFLHDLSIYLEKQRAGLGRIITPENAIEHAQRMLHGYTEEVFVVVCLDESGNIIKIHNITNHESDKVYVNLREIIAVVTSVKTRQVVLSHNHLSNNKYPSMEDMQLTRRLLITFQNLEVKFLDHIIFSYLGHYSFHCSGLMKVLKTSIPSDLRPYMDKEDRDQITAKIKKDEQDAKKTQK